MRISISHPVRLALRASSLLKGALLVALILVLGYLIVLIGWQDRPSQRAAISSVLIPLAGLLAAAGLFYAAAQTRAEGRPRLRLAWLLLGLAQLATVAGDLIPASPAARAADAFHLLFYPLFVGGILLLPAAPTARRDRVKLLLDAGIMLLAAGVVFWAFRFSPEVMAREADRLHLAISLSFPIGDLALLLALVLLLLRRPPGRQRFTLQLLTASTAILFATDFVFGYQEVRGMYQSGGWLDAGWLISYALIGLAGVVQAAAAGPVPAVAEAGLASEGAAWASESRPWTAYMAYAALGLAAWLVIAGYDTVHPDGLPGLQAGAAGLVGLVVLRQLIALYENARLLAAERQRRQADAVLLDLSRRLLEATDESSIAEAAVEVTVAALRAEYSTLVVPDSEGKLRIRAWRGWPPALAASLDLGQGDESQSAYTIQQRRPVVADFRHQLPFKVPSAVREHGLVCALSVPMDLAGRVVGAILVHSRAPRHFDEAQIRLFSLIANQTAVALDRARLFEAQRYEVDVKGVLLEITRAAQAAISIDDLMQAVAQSLSVLADCDRCLLCLWDAQAQGFRPVYAYPAGAQGRALSRLRWLSVVRPADLPLAERVYNSYSPLVISESELARQLPARWMRWLKLHGVVIAPLRAGDRLVGVLAVDHYYGPRPFTRRTLLILEALSHQLALTLQRVQLFDTVQRQVRELTVLHAVATVGAEATDEDSLLESATRIIGESLQLNNFGVMLVDASAGLLRTHPSYRYSGPIGADRDTPVSLGRGVTGRVAATGQPIRTGDVVREPGYLAADSRTQSELCVPLKAGERILGVINAESEQPNAFTEADERLLMTFAGQLATAIEKLRLFQAEKRRVATLTALHETGLDVSRELDLPTLLRTIVERAARLLDSERGGLYLLQPDRATLELMVSLPAEPAGLQLRLGEGLAGRVAESGAPLILGSPDAGLNGHPPEAPLPGGSLVGVPINWQSRVLGVLTVEDSRPGRYATSDAEIVRLFADQAAVAIINAQVFEAEREQRSLAETLREVGAVLSATLDLDVLLDCLLDQLARIVPYDAANFMLVYDGAAHVARLRGYEPLGDPVQRDIARLALPISATANLRQMAETGRPHIVPDTAADPDWFANLASARFRSWAGAPVYLQSEGLVGIFSLDKVQPNFYRAQHAERLAAFAGQAAFAVQNARLFTRTQQRELELATLLDVARSVSASLEPREVLLRIATAMCQALRLERCRLSMVHADSGRVEPLALYSVHGEVDAESLTGSYRLEDYAETARVIQGEYVAVIRAAEVEAQTGAVAWLGEFGDQVLLMLALRAGGQVEGLAELFTRDAGREFSADEIHFARALADQTGLALANARLYEAERQQRELAEALQETGEILGGSLDFDTVVDRLLDQAARVVPYVSGNVMLVEPSDDPGQTGVRIARTRGYGPFGDSQARALLNLTFNLATTPLLAQMIRTGQPCVIPDVRTEPAWVNTELTDHIRSWIGMPISLQGQVVGFFSLDHTEPNFYRHEHARRLMVFARQAALALQNAQFFAAQTQRAAELEALRQASLSLTASLDLSAVLDTILETTFRLVAGVRDAHIFLYHSGPDQELLTFGAALWSDGQRGQVYNAPRPEGLTYTVARRAEPIIVTDIQAHPLFANAPHMGDGAIVGLPLQIGARVVGVMNVSYPAPRTFAESELRMLRLLADQAAIAIENARLFEAERVAREQSEALREVANTLGADLDPERLLRLMLEQLARVVSYDTASVMLVTDDRADVVAQHSFPLGQVPFTEISISDLPHVQALIEQRRPAIIPDTRLDPRWYSAPGSEAIRCWLGVPLVAQDRVIGLLNLDHSQPGFYTERDAELAAAFANQSALALQNARLFEAERRQLQLAQTLQAVGALLTARMSLSDVFESLFDLLAQVIHYDSVSVQLADEAGQMSLAAGRGFPDLVWARENVRYVSQHRPAESWLEQNLLLIPDTHADERWIAGPRSDNIRSWIGAALIVRGQLIGILTTDSATPNAYHPSDGETVMAFANQAAVAIVNARLFEEAQRKTQELAGLYDAALATTSVLETKGLLDRLYEQTRLLIKPDTFVVALLDSQANEIEIVVAVENGQHFPSLRKPLAQAGLIGWVIRTGQPLTIGDIQSDPLPVQTEHITMPARAWLGVPLLVRDRIIGAVSLQSFRPGAFTAADQRFLESLAGQVAIAIENARLYEALAGEKSRLELLYDLNQNLITTLDPFEVADRALANITQAFGAFRGSVHVVEPGSDRLPLLAMTGYLPGSLAEVEHRINLRAGEGLAGWAAARRVMVIVDDVTRDPRWKPVAQIDDEVLSAVSIPLIAGDELVGVLNLHGDQPRSFHAEQGPLLVAAAASVAVSLQNAQLFAGMRRQASEVTAASEILHALNASPDVNAAFPAIAAGLRTITHCERVSLALLSRETVTITALDQPRSELPLGRQFPAQATAAATDVLNGRIHITPDLAAEQNFPVEQALYAAGHRSRLNLPLRVGQHVLGSLNLVWPIVNGQNLSLLPLLSQIADAVALGLEKSRLYNETRRRDAILQALAYSGERLLTPGHLGEVLPDVLERLGRAAQISRANIFENHITANSVLLTSQRYEWVAPGQAARIDHPHSQDFAYLANGFERWVAQLVANQPLYGPVSDFPPEERALLESLSIRSIAVAPIFSGGVWWGYLGFEDCQQERNWSAAEIEALKSTADSLGAAFARQRSEVAEREQRALAEALRDTAAALNSTLNFDEVLDRILTNAGRVVPHDAATIMLIQARVARIVRSRASAEGMLADDLSGLRFPIREVPNLRRMMETGRPLAIPDTQAHPDGISFTEASWARSYAATPIKQKGRLIGFINLYSATPGFFTSGHAERLRTFTDQAGIAIENAQLYDQILQHAEQLERRVAERTRALEEANTQLKHLDVLKDQFISTVSHELRTPLTNIKIHLGLLEKRGPEILGRQLPTLQRETERLRKLIEDLLDLSRLQTQSVPLQRQLHRLDELIAEVVGLHAARAEAKELVLVQQISADAIEVPADRPQILQVFTNLLGNAVAYTPPGGRVTVRAQPARIGLKSGVKIQFHNDNPIIPAEDLPHLFERFYRGRTGLESGEPGTGLGLAICKEIVERHNGRIDAESSTGAGTTFTLWLPINA